MKINNISYQPFCKLNQKTKNNNQTNPVSFCASSDTKGPEVSFWQTFRTNSYTQKEHRTILRNAWIEDEKSIERLYEAMKDNSGKISRTNVAFLKLLCKQLINSYSGFNENELCDCLIGLINYVKNENGKARLSKIAKESKEFDLIKNLKYTLLMLEELERFPLIKQNSIREDAKNKCYSTDMGYRNAPGYIYYCYDEKGEKIPQNVAWWKKAAKNSSHPLTKNFFKFVQKYPQTKDTLAFISQYTESESPMLEDFEKFVNHFAQKDGKIDPQYLRAYEKYTKERLTTTGALDFIAECTDRKTNKFSPKIFNEAFSIINEVKWKSLSQFFVGEKTRISAQIASQNYNPAQSVLADNIKILSSLRQISKRPSTEKAIQDILFYIKNESKSAQEIDAYTKYEFLSEIIAATTMRGEAFDKKITQSIDHLKSQYKGLSLKYPREAFLRDLTRLCDTPEKVENLESLANIATISQNGEIIGYNGLIKAFEPNYEDKFETELSALINKFLYSNKVIDDDKELEEYLNIIIRAIPEFINLIGKKQHGTQAYSLDIHCLLVLANSINNPQYQNLAPNKKGLLKFCALIHDIGKDEFIVHSQHPYQGSVWARKIAQKFFKDEEFINHSEEIIRNHHWLAKYNTSYQRDKDSPIARQTAAIMRHPEDYTLYKILTKADLMSVNDGFYDIYSYCFDEGFLKPIEENIQTLNSNGCALFSDYIVNKSKLKHHTKTMPDGEQYCVIDIRNLDEDYDMGEFGFRYGTKKKDLALLVHMTESENVYSNMQYAKIAANGSNGGLLSTSLTNGQNRTYDNRIYGLLLRSKNYNIAQIKNENIMSGNKKGFEDFVFERFKSKKSFIKTNYGEKLLNNLGINPKDVSGEDFAQFYLNVLTKTNHLNQIDSRQTYRMGKFEFSGEKLIAALNKTQTELVQNPKSHNEILCLSPIINAVIAKTQENEGLESLPEGVLRFARENNLPIILV